MEVLFISPRFPYPTIKGDQTVIYHRLRSLSKWHKITLLTFYESEQELENINILKPFCKEIHCVRLSKFRSFLNIISRCITSKLPLQVLYYYSPEFKNKLETLLVHNKFDIIHTFLLRLAPYSTNINVPKVLELIDSMQLNLERRIKLEPGLTRWIFGEEFRRISNYEQSIHKVADHLILVSDKDKKFINGSNVEVIPNGVDTEIFFSDPKKAIDGRIIFSGNMGYAPNIHAVKWFVNRCWPYIKKKNHQAILVIAGGNVSKEIKRLSNQKDIILTGYVKSMADELRKSKVAIAPMQSGSGIQNKILEAMACGLPVITTTLGLGCIKASQSNEVVIANNPEEFAQAVIDLLDSPDLAVQIGMKGYEFVKREHCWGKGALQVNSIYERIRIY